MTLDLIRETIAEYQYGAFAVLDSDLEIRVNPAKEEVLITPFHHHHHPNGRGLCSELMNTAYLTLKERFPNHYFVRADGHDSNYFVNGNHCFLLMSPENLMGEIGSTDEFTNDNMRLFFILNAYLKNPLLIDPSFGIVTPFLKSDYEVTRMVSQGYGVQHSNSCLLGPRCLGVPLGLGREGKLFTLTYDFTSHSILKVGVLNKQNPLDLNSSRLDQVVDEEEEIRNIVAALRGAPLTEVPHLGIDQVIEIQ